MSTREERINILKCMLVDEDLNLSPSEGYRLIYKALKYEYLRARASRIHFRYNRAAEDMQNEVEVMDLRKQLSKI